MIDIQVLPNIFYPKLARVCAKDSDLVPDVSITFEIELLNDQNIMLDKRTMTIEGTQYEGWGDDDTYIEDAILTNLALTRSPTE